MLDLVGYVAVDLYEVEKRIDKLLHGIQNLLLQV